MKRKVTPLKPIMRTLYRYGFYTMSIMTPMLTACTDSGTNTIQQPTAEEQRAQRYANAITTLLAQDVQVNRQSKGDNTQLVAEMRKLDMSQCPRDFALAYLDHIHAWGEAAEIQQALKALRSDKNVGDVMKLTIIQKLFGSDETALSNALEMEKKLLSAAQNTSALINETYHEVERIAVAYGATLPKK